jgi:hypothetical protein
MPPTYFLPPALPSTGPPPPNRQFKFFSYFHFIIFTFTYMCIHCLGHLPPPPRLPVNSNFEFINELNHSLDQSPRDLTGNTLTDTAEGVLY